MGTAITPPAVKDTALGRVGRVRPGMDASNRQCGNCRVVIFRGLVCSAICAATGGGGLGGGLQTNPNEQGHAELLPDRETAPPPAIANTGSRL